jgi:nucleotide-binding universal stress UspA family protein
MRPAIHRILVALDDSPHALEVLRNAHELARQFSAQLLLFRAIDPDAPLVPSPSTELLPEEEESMARWDLDALAKSVAPECFAGVKVLIGHPWQAILQAAREEQADLIVIGAHNYNLRERLLGTTASRVVNHADRPVLVVRRTPPSEAIAPAP